MTPIGRILVGAGSFADARAALALMRDLVRRSGAQIGGLLVEETTFAEVPRLGRQRIVTHSGAMIAAPTPRQVRAMIERDARAFEAALAEFAGVTRPLARGQGDLALSAWEASQGWDAVVLGQRALHALPGRIVLIAPPGDATSDAPAFAAEIAGANRRALFSLEIAEGVDATTAKSVLLDRIARINCTAVVLDRTAGPLRDVDTIRRLLSVARCPVFVLGRPTPIAGKRPVT